MQSRTLNEKSFVFNSAKVVLYNNFFSDETKQMQQGCLIKGPKMQCILSMQNKILKCIKQTNKALNQKDLSIDYETKLITGLRSTLLVM